MKIKTKLITSLSAVMLIALCLLVRYASHSTNETIRRRAVMAYYHTVRCSAEKREAARYLLDNMPYHYGYGVTVHDNKEVRHWAEETSTLMSNLLKEYGLYRIPNDTIGALREMRRADSLAMRRIDRDVQAEFIPVRDDSRVTAAFLIRHINHAFKVWRTSRFAQGLSFDEFKEYILPYKAFNGYSFLESADTYDRLFGRMIDLDSLNAPSDCIQAYNYVRRTQRALTGTKQCEGRKGLYDLFFSWSHACDDLAAYACCILRSMGVPITIEHTVGYRSFTGKHYFCSLYDAETGNWATYNPEAADPTLYWEEEENLNIYRNTYGAQRNTPYFLHAEGEHVPDELSNPCMMDVTAHVKPTHSITLPVHGYGESNLAYLATFNRAMPDALLHTTWGTINKEYDMVTFEHAMPNVLYFPVYYRGTVMEVFGTPFYLDERGSMNYLPHVDSDREGTMEVTLTRKFPRKKNMIKAAEELVGSVFIGSNDHSMRQADTLYHITTAPDPAFMEYRFAQPKAYQIYRFDASPRSGKSHIAMLEWVTSAKYGYENTLPASRVHILTASDILLCADTTVVKILDEPIEKMQRKAEYDGDMQTAPSPYGRITFWLKQPQVVTAVRFAPLNADNGINSDDVYELYYWDEGWKKVATKTARYEHLTFIDVPAHRIYWLRNITKGKEEQLFVIDAEGRQRFVYSDVMNIR